MAYKIINEELKIASCSIADLTMEQVVKFLKIWNDNSKIGALTMFYDKDSEYLVLNKDNELFQLYLDIAETYLTANAEKREMIRREAPKSMLESLNLLDGFKTRKLMRTWINRALQNSMKEYERELIISIPGPHPEFTAYRLGVIRGKRIERAKKKKAGVSNVSI